jgi:aminopeptidase N
MKKLLCLLLLSSLLCGCVYNKFGQVPIKSGKYPDFNARDTLKGMLDSLRAAYDVTFYDLDLKINPADKSLGGSVSIYFTVVNRLSRLRFDLYWNLTIDSLKIDGLPLSYVRNDRAVIALTPAPLSKDSRHIMKVWYGGKPVEALRPPWEGGMVWKTDKSGKPWIGVSCEYEGPSLWFPCKDHMSDEPDSVRLKMTVPDGLKVVSNGLMKIHTVEDGKESYTWETHYPINPYNITFYVGDFVRFGDTINTDRGVLHLNYHVLPYNIDLAKEHFKQAKDVIRVYSDAFGPYPWIKEGYKLVESPFNGMEHQTAIAYGSDYKNSSFFGGDYIIIHETAHEWWGNAVSVSDFSDIWLQEGFATYSEFVFLEHKFGRSSALDRIEYYALHINNKLPVVGPQQVGYWDYKDGDVYIKGAMVLHTMRNVISNDPLFFDILRTFYSDYACGAHPTTSDFINLVEKKTGHSWKSFFDVYLYKTEVPKLIWYYTSFNPEEAKELGVEPHRSIVVARWAGVPENFSMLVEIYCPDTRVSSVLNVTTKTMLFELPYTMGDKAVVCNKGISYFKNSFTENILKEFEKR